MAAFKALRRRCATSNRAGISRIHEEHVSAKIQNERNDKTGLSDEEEVGGDLPVNYLPMAQPDTLRSVQFCNWGRGAGAGSARDGEFFRAGASACWFCS